MTTPYPPKAPKRLERSRSDKFLFGVCGGVARYLNLDPTLVRVLTVVLTLFTGVPVIVYLVAAFVMPEDTLPAAPFPPAGPAGAWTPPPPPPAPPVHPTTGPDPIWGTEGAPWEQQPSAPVAPVDPDPVRPTDPTPNDPTEPRPPAPADPEAPVVPPSDASR